MNVRQPVDFEEIVEEVKSYSSPVDGHKPLEIQSVEPLKDVMDELIHGLAKRGVEPEKCAFWMHPETKNDYLDSLNATGQFQSPSAAFRGRPILTANTMPKDHILFAAPDAIALGGKVYNPLCVGYAQLHDVHPEVKEEFDEKWEQFVEAADDIDERLGLDYDYADREDRKEHVRELWLENKLTFMAGVPVIKSEAINE